MIAAKRPRVLLADDHALVSAGISKLLENDFDLIGTVADGRALVDAARQLTDLPYISELVASAVQRGKILVAHLVRELDAGSAAGSARMRLVLGEVAEGVRSTAEADLRTLIIQASCRRR